MASKRVLDLLREELGDDEAEELLGTFSPKFLASLERVNESEEK